ncbi:hypothetical protein Tco_0704523 [Tanacetum coccineum]|uniref:Uncharacterized protein n=1 Tax=Tanacetum coccineum TaxID=301880 RepID=A0ABQ4Y3U8_9ASTR
MWHIESSTTFIGIANRECVVLPPSNNNAAMPLEATFRANGFEYNKLIRFSYMHEVEDLDAENEADGRYPVFRLC